MEAFLEHDVSYLFHVKLQKTTGVSSIFFCFSVKNGSP